MQRLYGITKLQHMTNISELRIKGDMRKPPQDLLDIFNRFHVAIDNLVKQSRRDGLERGFPICEKEAELYHLEATVGTEATIPKMKTCHPDKNIAIIHTHPGCIDSTGQSSSDPLVFAFSDLKYLCAIDTEFYYDKRNHIHCMNRIPDEDGLTIEFEWIDSLL